jgi:hypothetical protein
VTPVFYVYMDKLQVAFRSAPAAPAKPSAVEEPASL